ncbi:MAG: hypothetical protein MUC43_15390 [Pirellula sp.]|jgi:hypothetical protein|nr:hypothetical protein [Pirellula sp.]
MKPMYSQLIFKWAALFCGSLGIVILLIAIWTGQYQPISTTIPLQFDESEFVQSDFPIREESMLALGIANPNPRSIRVLGIVGSCGKGGCVEAVDFHPFTVGSGGRETVKMEFKSPNEPGPIHVTLVVHYSLDSNSVQSQPLVITGNAVDRQ